MRRDKPVTSMLYLSGAVRPEILAGFRPDFGVMLEPLRWQITDPKQAPWAADNGCFAQGDAFDPERWLAWLEKFQSYRASCLFAVAPDVIGDARATLTRSLPYLVDIRRLGFPAAFVTQDGCTSDIVPWAECDALFVGGTNAWKLSDASWALCNEGKRRGKWVHVGRVNTISRLRACRTVAVDSVDGTKIRYSPNTELARISRWLDEVNSQLVLGEAI